MEFIEELPKKENKTRLIAVRVPENLYERIAKLKSNPVNDIPQWLRSLIERELDKIGA